MSIQTEFNIHLRYVFPSMGLGLVFLGQGVFLLTNRSRMLVSAVASLVLLGTVSSIAIYPHHLAYFNEFVGGPLHGHKHLLGSSLDWGQDWLEVLTRRLGDSYLPVCQFVGDEVMYPPVSVSPYVLPWAQCCDRFPKDKPIAMEEGEPFFFGMNYLSKQFDNSEKLSGDFKTRSLANRLSEARVRRFRYSVYARCY